MHVGSLFLQQTISKHSHIVVLSCINCCYIFYYVLIIYLKAGLLFFFLWLDAGRLAVSQYPEGPVTGHLDTGLSWFPCVLEQMLGWFPTVPSCHYMLPM